MIGGTTIRDGNWPAYPLLAVALAYFTYLAFATSGFYGGADEIVHYWMSRYSWTHPSKFLDLWGKPLYTTLSSPFAQLGFGALRLFNVLLGVASSWLAFRILQSQAVKHAWLAIPLTLSAPAYFALLPSALTEVLFSFVLMLGILLFVRNRFNASALVLSLLPFARNEGFIILLAVALLLVWRRKLPAIALLFSGYLLFSIIGLLVFGDFLWLWHQNPYTGNPMYGTGELLHFVKEIPRSTGLLVTVLALTAWLLLLLPDRWRSRWGLKDSSILVISLFTFAPYFIAHSYVWWSGTGSSLGLVRVMGAVSPVLALPAVWLFSWLTGRIRIAWLQYVPAVLLLAIVVPVPFRQHRPPLRADEINVLSRQAAQWLNGSEYAGRMLYFYDPTFLFYSGRNPYDQSRVWEQLPNKQNLSQDLAAGSIVVWDAHFGNNEGNTPKDRLLSDPGFRLLKTFVPPDTIYVLNDFPYEILILERIEP